MNNQLIIKLTTMNTEFTAQKYWIYSQEGILNLEQGKLNLLQDFFIYSYKNYK